MRWFYYLLPVVLIAAVIFLALPGRDRELPSTTASTGQIANSAAPGAGSAAHNATPASAQAQSFSSADQYPGQPADTTLAPAADAMPLTERLQAMHNRRAGQSYDRDAVAAAVARNSAWRPLAGIPDSLPLTPVERNDGRQFIEFDPLKLETLMPGDEITIAVTEHGIEYRGRIDSIEIHDGGSISWFGHLVGLDNHYSMTFTRGKSLTVGGMDTPEGHYVLQSHDELGWIASSETLFKRNPDETDAIIPPEGHDHRS
jgi:hypothetical protein